jgi:hypothetical protein
MPIGSVSSSIARSPIAATSALPPGCAMPATTPSSRISITAPRAASIVGCSKSSPAANGKSWLACALGHKACRDNRSVLYQRVPKLFAELALARGDGRYARIMRSLNGTQLLIRGPRT